LSIAFKPSSGESDDIGPDGGIVEQAVPDAGADDFLRRFVRFDVAHNAGFDSEAGKSTFDGSVKLSTP
jgi:hypothetical protein